MEKNQPQNHRENPRRRDASARRNVFAPKPLSSFVPDILRNIPGFDTGFAQLVMHWHSIIGEPLCHFTTPDKIINSKYKNDGAILQLIVTGAAAIEIQHQQPQILERINGYFGHRWITGLRLVHGTVQSKLRPMRDNAQPSAAPFDLPQDLESVKDQDLQTALRNLGQAVFRSTS